MGSGLMLTKEQKKHLNSFKWLIQGGPRSGKTFLLAYAMLEIASENPGRAIHIFDHNSRNFSYIIQKINFIYTNLYSQKYNLFMDITNYTFQLKLKPDLDCDDE